MLAEKKGFDAVAEHEVDDDVAEGDDDGIRDASDQQSEEDGRYGSYDGAEGGDEVESEGDDAPEQREAYIHVFAEAPCEDARGEADEGFDDEVALDALQRIGEFPDVRGSRARR